MRTILSVLGLFLVLSAIVSATPQAELKSSKGNLDSMLELAQNSPSTFMFGEQLTTKIDGYSELTISGTLSETGEAGFARLKPGKMKILRLDASKDDFTKQGGFYWRSGKTEGKAQFKNRGAIVMVVYQMDGTVHWYSMILDLRC
jgi:hypothetical protein